MISDELVRSEEKDRESRAVEQREPSINYPASDDIGNRHVKGQLHSRSSYHGPAHLLQQYNTWQRLVRALHDDGEQPG
jgi:hypothetical protein